MRRLRVWLLCLHAFVAVGALAGGWAAMTNPIQPLGAPLSLLEHSPFPDFFIPGLLLFFVIGVGNLASFILSFEFKTLQVYVSNTVAWALMIWIVVQVLLLRVVDILHVLFFLIGLTQAVIAYLLLFQKGLFPAPQILTILKRVRNR